MTILCEKFCPKELYAANEKMVFFSLYGGLGDGEDEGEDDGKEIDE